MDSIIKIFSAAILAFVVFINSIGNFLGIGDLIPTQPDETTTAVIIEESTTDITEVDTTVFSEEPTIPTEVPTTLPEVPTTLPEVPTTLPEVPTTLPEAPTTLPEVPTTLPEVPTTLPEVPTTLPEVPTTLPEAPTTLPVETTTIPVVTTTVPEETTTEPVEEYVQCVIVDGKNIYFGWDEEKITAVLGDATETIYETSKNGENITSLVYASDYSELAVCQLVDGAFSGFYTIDTETVVTDGESTYSIASSGETSQSKLYVNEYKDSHQNDMVYAVYVSYNGFSYRAKDLSAQDGQSRLNFHVVNGLRALHGVYDLKYCEKAEAAINLHCTDMAERDYFNHASPEGEQVWDRLNAQGISYRACAENILYSSFGNAFDYADAWYNSKKGHREGMLSTDYDYIGISFVVAANGITYGGQNFYRPW